MTSSLTQLVARGLLIPILVVALAILIKGYADVGDGFAAGVVAALGVLLQVVAFGRDAVATVLPLRWSPVMALTGLALGAAMFAVPLLFGGAPLQHLPAPGVSPLHIGSLELITAVVFDVAVFLLVLGVCVSIIDAIAGPGEGEQ